jgi:hypothetical protein
VCIAPVSIARVYVCVSVSLSRESVSRASTAWSCVSPKELKENAWHWQREKCGTVTNLFFAVLDRSEGEMIAVNSNSNRWSHTTERATCHED